MKIIVSGKEGIGKGELIHALTQEAPEHDYVEVSNEISDMEAQIGRASCRERV